ncbi:hypothetical protein MLD38_007394 [Melastoma candidum]|uniref:Uncharacterized protein n=1 Tax=Melastoma candidum TaxID=119954 RepID=A0ACB9RQM4_9MYRT|nr:hypothetical protein MLD38_007394 [Melastoma candidum]
MVMGEGDTDNWVIQVNQSLTNFPDQTSESKLWDKRSIYKVSPCIADLNNKAYRPQAVSFGPYHHGEDRLSPMEEHKPRALLHFLRRSRKPLEEYLASLREIVGSLMGCYDPLDPHWKGNEESFLRLMILDGCFMLEILRTEAQSLVDYAANDPIFSNHGKLYIMPFLRRDMLMIENQLPISLLERLVAVETDRKKGKDYVVRLILKFCSSSGLTSIANVDGLHITDGLHILDIYRQSLLKQANPKKPPKHHMVRHLHRDSGGGEEIIRSASELDEAGIQFKKVKNGTLRDISFKNGVLKLPVIVVDDTTETIFLNLIAFERLHVGAGNEVTSYIFFMDNIIDSNRDVALLHSRGIIQSAIGSDKAVAKLFNSLSKDITLDPDSELDAVQNMVSDYCKKPWNVWRANLIHTYFTNPWAILSLIAAVFLFALTIAQTVYTIIPFYK